MHLLMYVYVCVCVRVYVCVYVMYMWMYVCMFTFFFFFFFFAVLWRLTGCGGPSPHSIYRTECNKLHVNVCIFKLNGRSVSQYRLRKGDVQFKV
jgi:hypothetical protein